MELDYHANGKEISSRNNNDEEKTNQATAIATFALSRIDLLIDKNKQVFAKDKTTNEVWHLASRRFRDWLMSSFYDQNKKIIRNQSINEALSALTGIGRTKNYQREINIRVATLNGDYYIDLCQNGNSKAVKISAGDWEIIENPPVIFIRPDTMQLLPSPSKEAGYDLKTLWNICNIPHNKQILIITYLLEALRPDTPYPLLEILGEQGSAKSTTQAILRRIIDPNACDLRATPKSPEDLYIAAGSNHLMSYENVSHLTPAIQDGFCTIATGGGFAKRKLYFDSDEVIIHAKNPVMINGISAVITAPDLIDRTITIDLPAIINREESPLLWDRFKNSHGKILGILLNIFATALSKLPNIEMPSNQRPRLIEFARLGMAIAEAIGLEKIDFMNSFNQSRLEAIERTIDENPVITPLLTWFEANDFKTTQLPLHELFEAIGKNRLTNSEGWPKTTKSFGDTLRRIAPVLRPLGVDIKSLGKRGAFVRWQVSSCDSPLKSSRDCLHVSQQKDLET